MMRRLAWAFALLFAAAPAAAAVYTVQPGPEGEDASPYSFFPSLNRGTYPTNYVVTGTDENNVQHEFETYVRFALPAVNASRVVDAYVRFYYAFDFSGFGDPSADPAEIHCHEVLQAWSEGTLNWNNRPARSAAFDVDGPIAELDSYMYCDVTDLVKDWLTGAAPNYGIVITNPTERTLGMYSFEDTSVLPDERPTLVIKTSPPSGTGCGMLGLEAWPALAGLEALRRRKRRAKS